MSYPKIEILFLNEEDMIKAGVTDMKRCVEVMEEAYELLGTGDYLMGGKNANSHGQMIVFPEKSDFPNMPLAGPDRRFMSMISYVGGRFNVCGEKWYGSNRENLEKGLPRSILLTILNDAKTGAPLTIQSANLLSAYRTGAIPGVGAKYLTRKGSKVLGLVAAGPIARTSFMGISEGYPNLEVVKIFDINKEASKALAKFIEETYPQYKEIIIVDSMEEAVRDSDIVNIAASGKVTPELKEEWIKKGALVSLPAAIILDKDFVINRSRVVVDNWKMYEAYRDELDYPYTEIGSVTLDRYLLDWIEEGEITKDFITDLGDIVVDQSKGRKNDDEIIFFVMGGQPIYDVTWGYTCYEKAKELGLGQLLKLWDEPLLK
ncbi:MAG: ornithine cyclodeaminase [Synergistaceae bacterium]|nr:ornithine cyclodeaminase [Synergistaceae bacterium]